MSIYAGALGLIVLFLLTFWVWTMWIASSARRAVPKIGKTLAINGNEIHYTDEGPRDAPVLVMIHGLTGNLRNFSYLIDELSSEFRVINLDRPGSGYSTLASQDQATLFGQARAIGGFLDELGVKKPVLVGHSLGGAVALAMAVDQQDKIGALALLGPLTQMMDKPPEVFEIFTIRPNILRQLIGYTLAAPVSKLTGKHNLAQAFSPEPVPTDFREKGGAFLGQRPATFFGAAADLEGLRSSLPELVSRYKKDLTTPGGILYGADDNILNPDLQGRIMETRGLSFEELPGRGHMIPVTAPKQCAEFIRRIAQMAQ